MASLLSKIDRFLRSRKLAATLIVGVTAYALAVTLVPLGPLDSPKVTEWARLHPLGERIALLLGLHHAYTTPLFLIVAFLLTLSTAACSVERTRHALMAWARRGRVDGDLVRRVDDRPTFVVEIPEGTSADEALDRASSALRRLRMRVRRGSVMAEARSNSVGLVGSPLFHWSLVGLFVLAGLGQLTRSEGALRAIVGGTVADRHDEYVYLSEGPWFGERHTNVRLTVSDFKTDIDVDGVLRGPSPQIELADEDSTAVGRQWVYPNNPLRRGSLLVHAGESGPALVTLLQSSESTTPQTNVLYLKRNESAPLGIEPLEVSFDDSEGTSHPFRLEARQGQKVALTALKPVRGVPATQVVGLGDSVVLPGGYSASIDRLTGWVDLTVVNDWTIPFIYVAFLAGTLGVALTVFLPPRVALLKVAGAELKIKVLVSVRRTDPAYASRVRREVVAAIGREPDSPVEEA